MSAAHSIVIDNHISSLDKQRPFLVTGFTNSINIATDLSESTGSEKLIDQLENCTTVYAELEREVDALKSALTKIKTVLGKRSHEDEIPDLPRLLDQYMKEAIAKAGDRSVREHPRCVEFRQKVYGSNDGQAASSTAAEDEDLIVASVEVSMNCPITQKPFEDPVQNKACRHSYSKQAILDHLQKKHGRVRCPVLGCVQHVTKDGLQPDHTLQSKLRRQKHALPKR